MGKGGPHYFESCGGCQKDGGWVVVLLLLFDVLVLVLNLIICILWAIWPIEHKINTHIHK